MSNAVTCAGNSKCLILGGYLVLFHDNTALCVSLKPKVQCTAKFTHKSGVPSITVITHPAEKTFVLTNDIWSDESTFHGKYERFILAVCHVVFRHFGGPSLSSEITIQGDSEFYTSNGKTGLGSSAATTVALTRALCRLYFNVDDGEVVFRIASVAHSIAQGNVGSCFDISCAVWGTQEFRRPSPAFLKTDKINEHWDNEHMDFQLPPAVKIYLVKADFQGSSTPGLVKQFLAKADEDSEIFTSLKCVVSDAMQALRIGAIDTIRTTLKTVRKRLRIITEKWSIGIVPDEVNVLADRIDDLPGVIASVIPGAGGYDAIAVVAQKDAEIDFQSLGISVLAESC